MRLGGQFENNHFSPARTGGRDLSAQLTGTK